MRIKLLAALLRRQTVDVVANVGRSRTGNGTPSSRLLIQRPCALRHYCCHFPRTAGAFPKQRGCSIGAVASGGLSPPPKFPKRERGFVRQPTSTEVFITCSCLGGACVLFPLFRMSAVPAIKYSTTAASHPGRREPTAQSRGMVLCRIAESHPGSELPASSRSLSETRIAETPERERGLHFCFIKCCARQRRCRCVGTSRVLRPRCVHTHDWRFFSIDCFFSRSLVTSRHSSTGRHLALTLRRRDLC